MSVGMMVDAVALALHIDPRSMEDWTMEQLWSAYQETEAQ